MEKILENIASIRHNDPDIEDRVFLTVASEILDGEIKYFIISISGEDAGYRFSSSKEAEASIYDLWGKSPEWDLQWHK
jgi:hypothetical protein